MPRRGKQAVPESSEELAEKSKKQAVRKTRAVKKIDAAILASEKPVAKSTRKKTAVKKTVVKKVIEVEPEKTVEARPVIAVPTSIKFSPPPAHKTFVAGLKRVTILATVATLFVTSFLSMKVVEAQLPGFRPPTTAPAGGNIPLTVYNCYSTDANCDVTQTQTGINIDKYVIDKTGALAGNLMDPNVWTIGSGSVGNFSQNGPSGSNVRVWGNDPYGNQAMLWSSPNSAPYNGATNGADGGWNYTGIPVDNDKAYRVSVWIKRTGSNAAGYAYLGINGGNTADLNGTPNSNPYFMYVHASQLVLDRWYLFVGHIHAQNDASTNSYAAVYDGVTGNKISVVGGTRDYKHTGAQNVQTHRTYNYYDTNAATTQYFWGPRFEEVNGKEPSVEALLGIGKHATSNYDAFFGGNVGIGVTNPAYKLDVVGTDYNQIRVQGTNPMIKFAPFGYNSQNGAEIWQLPNGEFAFNTNSSTRNMTMTAAGRVGIGASVPSSAMLHVTGTDVANPSRTNIRVGGYTYLGTTGSGEATLLGNNMRTSESINNQIEIGASSADAAHGLYSVYTQGWKFVSLPQGHGQAIGSAVNIDANTKVHITNAGNVGIGVLNPSTAKLVVGGNIDLSSSAGGTGTVYVGRFGSRGGLAFDPANPNYGIFYTESSPDYVSISPNGQGDAATAVMRIDGNGNTVLNGNLNATGNITAPNLFTSAPGSNNYVPKYTSANSIGPSQVIDNGTNVGIGTASPAVKLEVSSAGTTLVTGLRVNTVGSPTAGAGGAIEFGSTVNAAASFPVAKIGSYLIDGAGGGEDGHMTLATMRNGTMTEAVRILNSGFVGINNPSPSYPLDVNGYMRAQWLNVQDAGGGAGIYSSYGNHFYVTANSNYWYSRSSYGTIYQDIGGATRGYVYFDGSGYGLLHSAGGWAVRTTPSSVDLYGTTTVQGNRPITFNPANGLMSIRADAGGWAFGMHATGSAGTDRGGFGFFGGSDVLSYYYIGQSYSSPSMVVEAGGDVGIGTANPTRKLTVNGEINYPSGWRLTTAWGADVLTLKKNAWDGVSNDNYGTLAAGHGYFYNGLQTGGGTGYEAGNGQLYVGSTSMLMGNVGVGTTAPATAINVVGTHDTTRLRLTLPAANNSGGTGEVNLQAWVSEPGVTWDGGGIGTNVNNDGAGANGFGRLNTGLGQSFIRFVTNGGAMQFNTTDNGGTYRGSTLYLQGGNVGIGTTWGASGEGKILLGTNQSLGSGSHGISWYRPDFYTWYDYMAPAGGTNAPSGAAAQTDPAAPAVGWPGVTSWARRFNIENVAGYGWIFESASNTPGTAPLARFAISSVDGSFHAHGSGLVDGNLNVNGTLNVGNFGIANTSPALIIQDTDSTGTAQVGFISLRDNGNVERAWIGDGSSGTSDISLYNSYNGKVNFYTSGVERVVIDGSGNVGIGSGASTSNRVNVIGNFPNVVANGTNYYKTLDVYSNNIPVAAGVIDSGYRIGLAIQGYVDSAAFDGTLATQYGIWARHGSYGAAAGSITDSYGIYIDTLTSGGTTFGDLYGLYQASAAAKNYFGGYVGIGAPNPAHQLTVGANTSDAQAVTIRGYSNTPASWKGGAAFGYTSASVIMGELSGVAQIGGHSATLNAWANLAINSGGGNVGVGTPAPGYKLDVQGTTRTTVDFLANGNYGLGLVGLYSPTRYQNVYAMGASYRLAADGSNSGNFYGLAMSYNPDYSTPGTNPDAVAGLNHQFLVMANGVTQTSIGTGVASHAFFDINDTSYYLNPASTSRLNDIRPNIITNPSAGVDSGITGRRDYQWGYQEGGPWLNPYPDLIIGYHTGMKMGAYIGYGGTRFYNDHPSVPGAVDIFSVGNGDNNVRVTNNLIVGGSITAASVIGPISDPSLVRTGVAGNWNIASNSSATDYTAASIELREVNFVGDDAGAAGAGAIPPRLSFHWGDVVASQIGIESDGTIRTFNNPGTGYEKFRASQVTTMDGDVITNGGNLRLAATAGETATTLYSYSSANSLWMLQTGAAQQLVLADAVNWDRSLSIQYTPGATGAVSGNLTIGQINKNSATYTHGNTSFYTNGAERVRIDSAGDLGIGTNSPNQKLAVTGNINVGNVDVESGYAVQFRGRADQRIVESAYSLIMEAPEGLVFNIDSNGNGTSTPFQVRQSSSPLFTILENGDAGVGAVSPLSKLQVAGTLTVGSAATAGSPGNVQITTGGVSPFLNRITYGTDGTGYKFAISKNQGGTVTEQLVVQDNGRVGIGVAAPSSKLDVVGGDINMDAGTTIYSRGRMHIYGEEYLYLLNRSGVIVSDSWGGAGAGNLTVMGSVIDITLVGSGTADNGDQGGYSAAKCAAAGTGYHMCSGDEIIEAIRNGATLPPVSAWYSTGSSGTANDCNGWTSSSSAVYGAFWDFATAPQNATGGASYITSCEQSFSIACCR